MKMDLIFIYGILILIGGFIAAYLIAELIVRPWKKLLEEVDEIEEKIGRPLYLEDLGLMRVGRRIRRIE